MHYPKELLERYWVFYRASYPLSSTGCVKPLKIAVNVLKRNIRNSDEELKDMISAEIMKLMDQIHRYTAQGIWVTSGMEELEKIQEFSRFFIEDFFRKAFKGDRSRLSGQKLATLEHTCEFLYKLKDDYEKQERNKKT